MLTTVWSVKGGAGCTVVSVAIAVMRARRDGRCVLVDLAGDLPAALGLAEPGGPGVTDWLAAPDSEADSLSRLLIDVGPDLQLLPVGGSSSWPTERGDRLVDALRRLGVAVVIDAGHIEGGSCDRADGSGLQGVGRHLRDAGTSTMVIRPCYLALRRAVAVRASADGVVLVAEVGRALDRRDVGDVLGLPVTAVVDVDPAVARSIDSGLFVRRLPKSIERQLRGAA